MATFTGGEKLKAYLAKLSEQVSRPGTLRVGFLEGATYPAGSAKALKARYKKRKAAGAIKGDEGEMSVPMVAALNEFGGMVKSKSGSYYRLPRPFFRRMIAAKSTEWGTSLAEILKVNDCNTRKSLLLMGEGIKAQLVESINELVSPPLAPSTVAAKGFDKPLIDSGHMLASVDYDVKT